MNRKALSDVIRVILIIFIILAAIAALGAFLIRFLIMQKEISDAQAILFTQKFRINEVEIANSTTLTVNTTVTQLAGQQKSTTNVTTSRPSPVDIVNLIDLSGSMSWSINNTNPDPYHAEQGVNRSCSDPFLYNGSTNKISLAKCITNQFISSILNNNSESRFGITAFGTFELPTQSYNLTNNLSALKGVVNNFILSDYTCICCGINYTLNMFNKYSNSSTQKIMILMTDGSPGTPNVPYNNQIYSKECGSPSDNAAVTLSAACQANQTLKNLTIYTIGFGLDANSSLLQQVAYCGGGQYYNASSAPNILEAYEQLGEIIQTKYQLKQSANFLLFTFKTLNGTSYYKRSYDFPDQLYSSKEYTFDISGSANRVIEVDIQAGITISNGADVIGPIMDIWKISN